MAEKTLVDRLLDADDIGPLELFTDEGEPVEFEQVAVIVYDEMPYTILHPVEGNENEVFVFEFYDDSEETISVIEDKKLAQNVLDEYKRKILGLQVSSNPKTGK